MKKISSPHKNNFIPKEVPINPSDITIEDLRKCIDEMGEDFKSRLINTRDLGNGQVELTGNGIHVVTSMKNWDDAILKAGGYK